MYYFYTKVTVAIHFWAYARVIFFSKFCKRKELNICNLAVKKKKLYSPDHSSIDQIWIKVALFLRNGSKHLEKRSTIVYMASWYNFSTKFNTTDVN